MRSEEIAIVPPTEAEPPPALPAGSHAEVALSASSRAAIGPADLLAPPPVLPAPRVRTWRPPVVTAPDDADERLRRSRERRDRLQRQRYLSVMWTTIKVGVVVFITYGLIFNFSIVRGSSMSPGIHDGDRILVDHVSLLFREVHHGDIVVLQYPLDPTLDYIKRVIGLPGDEVRIDGGRVWVNGKRLDEPYIAEPDPRTHLVETVEPDSFFVLGDNRPHSSDSREFGQVPRENLVGVVNLRVWPPARAGMIN